MNTCKTLFAVTLVLAGALAHAQTQNRLTADKVNAACPNEVRTLDAHFLAMKETPFARAARARGAEYAAKGRKANADQFEAEAKKLDARLASEQEDVRKNGYRSQASSASRYAARYDGVPLAELKKTQSELKKDRPYGGKIKYDPGQVELERCIVQLRISQLEGKKK